MGEAGEMRTPLLDGIRKQSFTILQLATAAGAVGGVTGSIIDKRKRWRGGLIGAGLGLGLPIGAVAALVAAGKIT